ncbi:hypothetical protein BU23DRAFT_564681 [Bimuria novae-zelandiae CBS 107.79]|uniref:Uncharacterized protein n=1 Tax=Bimuria novae-zelandiae CBS 107.79 TaxID=1447943 RepID=A0A6A5VM95_9PLEO|nr:hypothetical protein BU23DRAFT_564681 [Bimuria novae-zelandiae CBS 107.79]
MAESEIYASNNLEHPLTQQHVEDDLSEDLPSFSDHEESIPALTPVLAGQNTTKTEKVPGFSYTCEQNLPGTARAHLQIYVVNEQVIHGGSIWCSTLCAFDSLHRANTEARTHAIVKHAQGDASIVQVYFRNGYGTWTTIMNTERGRITKSVFVNATVLQHSTQHSVSPPMKPTDQNDTPERGDPILPSKVPGSQRVRRIQAFRSTDSLRIEVDHGGHERSDVDSRRAPCPKPLGERIGRMNHIAVGAKELQNIKSREGRECVTAVNNENAVTSQRSIDDLQEFASLHTLF